MSERSRRAERIVAVQRQMHRVETWKLAQLQQRLAEIEASKVGLIGALNSDEALHGLFIDAMAKRLRFVSEEAARIASERDLQSRKVVERLRHVRLAERLSSIVETQEQRAEMGKELAETIEHFLNRSCARLP
ncbi:MAG TPA: hypothetical protein VNK52_16365 [Hyphomicrobiaceae bacterium]|nr:hypothetical protein [Hyphomicrobiaceae bacterium]